MLLNFLALLSVRRREAESGHEKSVKVDNEMATLAIRDAGRGIPERVLEQFHATTPKALTIPSVQLWRISTTNYWNR